MPEDPDPSSSSLGSVLISGFLSSLAVPDDDEDVVEDVEVDVSMGSPLHPSPEGFSFLI